jgi:hypothetical protein
MKNRKPAKSRVCVLAQLCKLIPGHLVSSLAREYKIDRQARSFSAWSHVVSLLYAQLTHAIGLNDVCDGLRHHSGLLAGVRGATPPARNTLSHANKTRDSGMMEALFWQTLKHLQQQSGGLGRRYKGLPRRFSRAVHAIDSSTIALVANCMDWARHRRRKAAAKLHLRLDLQSFLPAFAIVEEASHHDDTRARQLCAGLREGEIAVFDKAYVNFAHLFELARRGVFWVTRAKDNMSCHVCKRLLRRPKGKVLRDDLVVLKVSKSKGQYPQRLRRIVMLVELEGKGEVEMVFITNNLDWAATSVGGLYQARWGIEVFFKQIKQTLKVCDFLGHSKQAIRWQVWAALLLYVLLRFQSHAAEWAHSFTRFFTLVRSVTWDRFDLPDLLAFYGTAGGRWRMRAAPEEAFLPGFEPTHHGTAAG